MSADLPTSATSTYYIGSRVERVDEHWHGGIDDVRIWDRALTQAEIIANKDQALTGFEPNLVGYFPLDEGTGQTAEDASGLGADGTLGETSGADVRDPVWVP